MNIEKSRFTDAITLASHPASKLATFVLLLAGSLSVAATPMAATPANTAKSLELIAREHYADAEAQARLWRDTSGSRREDKVRRLAGLWVLIDSRVDQALLITADDAHMLDQAESLTTDLYGPNAGTRFRPYRTGGSRIA